MRILVIAAKIHNFFRAQRRLDRLVIKIPGASQSSVYKNRFQQEAESVAPRNVRNVRTSIPIAPPMTAMAMLPMAAPRMARAPETAKEFAQYEFVKLKNGSFTESYPDRDNHAIDAVRYALNRVWLRKDR